MSFESVKDRYDQFRQYVKKRKPFLSSNIGLENIRIQDTLDNEMFLFLQDQVRQDLDGHLSLGCDKIDLSRLSPSTFGSFQSHFKHEYWSLYGFCQDWLIHLYIWRQTILPRQVSNKSYALFVVRFKLINVHTGETFDIPSHVQKWNDKKSDNKRRWKIVHKYMTAESELDNHLFPMRIRIHSGSLNVDMRVNGLWSEGVNGAVLHNVPSKSTGCLICADGIGHKLYYYPTVTGNIVKSGHTALNFTGSWFHEWQSGLNPFGVYSSLFLRALSITSESIGRSQHLSSRVNWCQFVLYLPSQDLKVFLWFVQPVIEYNTWLHSTFCYELSTDQMGISSKNQVVYKLKFSKFSDDQEHQLLECILVRQDNVHQLLLRSCVKNQRAMPLSSDGQCIENVSYFKVLSSCSEKLVDNQGDYAVYKYFPPRKLLSRDQFNKDSSKESDESKIRDGKQPNMTSKTDVVMSWTLILLPILLIVFIFMVVIIVWFKKKRQYH